MKKEEHLPVFPAYSHTPGLLMRSRWVHGYQGERKVARELIQKKESTLKLKQKC